MDPEEAGAAPPSARVTGDDLSGGEHAARHSGRRRDQPDGSRPFLRLQRSLSVEFNAHKVLDHVFVSGKEFAVAHDELCGAGVSHILQIGAKAEFYGALVVDLPGIDYMRVVLSDDGSPESAQKFLDQIVEPACDFIDKAKCEGGHCLVHCSMGMSRSPAVVLAYMVCRLQMTLLAAYALMRQRRPTTSPNIALMRALAALELRLRGVVSIDLEAYQDHGRFGEADKLSAE